MKQISSISGLILLTIVCPAWSGEKEIIQRLRDRGASVSDLMIDGEEHAIRISFSEQSKRLDLSELCELHRLRWLDLTKCTLTVADMRFIGSLAQLKIINMRGAAISNVGLKEIKGLQRLTCLVLDKTPITDEGMEHLNCMEGLIELHLCSTAVTDEGLGKIRNMRRLKNLCLCDTQVTDVGVFELAFALELDHLDLSDCRQVTDASVSTLGKFENMTHLRLDGTSITRSGASKLEKQMPRCTITLR